MHGHQAERGDTTGTRHAPHNRCALLNYSSLDSNSSPQSATRCSHPRSCVEVGSIWIAMPHSRFHVRIPPSPVELEGAGGSPSALRRRERVFTICTGVPSVALCVVVEVWRLLCSSVTEEANVS